MKIDPNGSITISTLGRDVTIVVATGDANVTITDQNNTTIATLSPVASFTLPKNTGNYTITYGAGTYSAVIVVVSN